MKRCFGLTLLIFFLLLAYEATASDLPEFPFVYATGEAEAEVAPDTARMTFRVSAFEKKPERALVVVEERSRELVPLFTKYSVDKKDVEAFELNKNTVRRTRNETELEILGYETERTFLVTFRNLEKYNSLVATLFALKNVSDIRTEFDSSKRRTVEAELVGRASAKAREQAEVLARGFGHSTLSVFAVTTVDTAFTSLGSIFGMGHQYRTYYRMRPAKEEPPARISRAKSATLPASTIFVPSAIKLQKSVAAIFKLKV